MSTQRYTRTISALLVAAAMAAASAQTKITPPKNSYAVGDDVKLGQEAAAEARKELPLLRDERLDDYVEGIGARLVTAIPPDFQHPEFRYSFDIINQKEINAFALPGGPMFLNRGMMEASKSEAEMAGVMAHEISHVALRHGTAQASKATAPGLLGALGQIGGAIVGGNLGGVIGLASQVGAQAWMTKYSREYESQADILGAQILARAGYDPREMANMFKTIQAEGGGGGPEWLSSHPDPGNRYNKIVQESEQLRVQGRGDSGQFAQMKARLGDMGRAYTAEEIAKGQAKTGNAGGGTVPAGTRTVNVEAPAARMRAESLSNALQVGVPSNWDRVGNRGVTYAPDGAFFQAQSGQTAFTHGVQFGVFQGEGNLERDTEALLQSFRRTNPQLQASGRAARDSVSGRRALTVNLRNVSEVTGQQELVALTTTVLPDRTLFYIIGVAPQSEASRYSEAFRRVRQSVRIK